MSAFLCLLDTGGDISAVMESSEDSRLRALRLDDVESLKTYTTWSCFGLGREVEADFAL
jgi:hypothetical protein